MTDRTIDDRTACATRGTRTSRRACGVVVLAAAALLGGCATLNVVDSNVSSYTQWPAERKPATFAFERLPSQQARPDEQAALESAARGALERAGFTTLEDTAAADVLVQLGARINRVSPPYDSRFYWSPSLWYGSAWRRPVWGSTLGFHYEPQIVEREVAVLIRDRQSGRPLFETRASNDGTTAPTPQVLAAMFDAALKDFPAPAVNPRRVRVELDR